MLSILLILYIIDINHPIQAELESAGGADVLIHAFQGLGDPLPLEDGSDCFAAQLPRILVRMLRSLLPLVAAHPPSKQMPPRMGMEALSNDRGRGFAEAGGGREGESALGGCFYGLAAAVMGLLGTLAAHGAASESRAVGLDGGVGVGKGIEGEDVGGSRWVKEIAVGVGGSDGSWGSGGAGGGRGLDVLEACWAVSRDIDGIRGEGCNRRLLDPLHRLAVVLVILLLLLIVAFVAVVAVFVVVISVVIALLLLLFLLVVLFLLLLLLILPFSLLYSRETFCFTLIPAHPGRTFFLFISAESS